MGYAVEFVELVLEYLAQVEGLTDPDRAAVIDGVIDELSWDADHFHALRPLAHESLCFWYDYPHPTERVIYDFDFIVDASAAEMGVVRVIYVECTPRPIA